jgi:DNA repair protein RadC
VRTQNALPQHFDNAADVANYIQPGFKGKRQECFLVILPDGQNRLLTEKMITDSFLCAPQVV